MNSIWKRFGEWVTALRSNKFRWAKIKLTALIFFIIFFIVVIYLVLLYNEFSRAITYFANENISEPDRRQRFIERAFIVTRTTLFGVQPEDVLTIFIMLGISFFLAGYVLKPIKEALALQKRFLADASHQLRTPLAIIKAEMEVFLQDRKNYLGNKELLMRKRQGVLSNLEEVDKMSKIIDELLLIARIDLRQETFHFGKIKLKEFLTRAVKKIEKYTAKNGIKIYIMYQIGQLYMQISIS
jgi:signal transduction histidine kinase